MSTKAVRAHFDDIHKNSLPYLEYTKKAYQSSWNKIGKKFSDYITSKTGYAWFYPKYECVVSITNKGVSNWGDGPMILRGWKENPYSQRCITAHELIISHYFEIHKRYYKDSGLSKEQIWALAEIAALALTSLSDTTKEFWPWDFSGYTTTHDIPQIVDLQKKLKAPFLKRKSFDEYILKGVKLVKSFRNIKP